MGGEMKSLALAIIERVEAAERISPAGSYDHGKYLRASLEMEWPSIKALLMLISEKKPIYLSPLPGGQGETSEPPLRTG